MSNVQWANVKFFPEPTGELYGWLLATLVFLFSEALSSSSLAPHPKRKEKKSTLKPYKPFLKNKGYDVARILIQSVLFQFIVSVILLSPSCTSNNRFY